MNKKIFLLSLLLLIPLLTGLSYASCPVPTTPAGIGNYVCITLTNNQAGAVNALTPINITLDAGAIQTYTASNMMNVELFYQNGTVANAILQGNYLAEQQTTNLDTSNTLMYWFKSPNTNTYLPANSGSPASNYIYFGIAPSTSTNLFNNYNNGEAPQLTSTYGVYDDGNQVYGTYCSWIGTSNCNGWTSGGSGFSFNNGLTMSTSLAGSYVTTNTAFIQGNIVDIYGIETPAFGAGNAWGGFTPKTSSDNLVWGWGINVYALSTIQYTAGAGHGGSFATGRWILTSFFNSTTKSSGEANYSSQSLQTGSATGALPAGYSCADGACAGTWTATWIDVRQAPPNNLQPVRLAGGVSSTTSTTTSTTTTSSTSTTTIPAVLIANPNPPQESNTIIQTTQISVINTIISNGIAPYTANWFWTPPNILTTGSNVNSIIANILSGGLANSVLTINAVGPTNVIFVFNSVTYYANILGTNTIFGNWILGSNVLDSSGNIVYPFTTNNVQIIASTTTSTTTTTTSSTTTSSTSTSTTSTSTSTSSTTSSTSTSTSSTSVSVSTTINAHGLNVTGLAGAFILGFNVIPYFAVGLTLLAFGITFTRGRKIAPALFIAGLISYAITGINPTFIAIASTITVMFCALFIYEMFVSKK